MKQSTKYPNGRSAFPPTSHSTIRAVWSPDETERSDGFEALISAYWMPVYKYLRIRWQRSIDDAKDLTQAFFLEAIEKDYFRAFNPERGRFRTFLRTCLDGFVSNHDKSAKRLKRGGAFEFQSLDFQDAENQIALARVTPGNSVEALFEREWRRSVFNMALDLFQTRSVQQGRELQFKLFERYVLDGLEDGRRLKYEDLAGQFGLSTATVTNYLAAARRDFRRAIFDKLRELAVGDDEFRREVKALLGVEPE